MIVTEQLKLHVGHTRDDLCRQVCKKLGIKDAGKCPDFEIIKRSLDARKKPDIFFVYSVEITEPWFKVPKKADKRYVKQVEDEGYDFLGEVGSCNKFPEHFDKLSVALVEGNIKRDCISGNVRFDYRQDPEKAEQAITVFSAFLRYNMDSLSEDRPVPFHDELAYVKEYLELQQLRFGDELKVEYDLEFTDFRIPTLTLQPLVENAVSYGVRRSENGTGVVTISTKKTAGHIEVSVKDDGPGFIYNSLPDDRERTHIGIRNVRERIEKMTGGEVIIDSEIGKGTKVTIQLPPESEEM